MSLIALTAVICLSAPVNGPIINHFAPVGQYAGHWGVDFAATPGTPVLAPVAGSVTFAGSVAGMHSVTIQPVPGMRVSVSYLSAIQVRRGEYVSRGDFVGLAGSAHGTGGVHLSVRIDGQYVDPEPQLGCVDTDITRALRLLTPPRSYPRRRAHRHPGWNLRSDSLRPSRYRLGGPRPAAARSDVGDTGR